MYNRIQVSSLILLALFVSIHASAFEVSKAMTAPVVDGFDDDLAWQQVPWHKIDQSIIGAAPDKKDFNGRYKVVWTQDKLFVLAEIIDDVLIDQYSNPLKKYWEDDAFEILIDENHSGGDHLKNYNAFAYHIALDNQVVDIDTQGKPRLLNEHIQSVWKRSVYRDQIIWEVSIDIYPDTFKDHYLDDQKRVLPVKLHVGKTMGFMIAYCDNDGANQRDNFMTSYDIEAVDGDKNRAYLDASVFQTIVLVEK